MYFQIIVFGGFSFVNWLHHHHHHHHHHAMDGLLCNCISASTAVTSRHGMILILSINVLVPLQCQFLELLMMLLEVVPLAARLELWFQQHGAAAHSDRSHAVMV
jgi:hypothetical protein